VRAQLWSRELPEKLLAVEFDRFNPEELWAASAEGNMYLINGTVALFETPRSSVLMDSTLIIVTWATTCSRRAALGAGWGGGAA